LAVWLNVSIEVTGTPNPERSALSTETLEYTLLTMAPPIPSDDCKKKHIPEMSHIVCGINADESTIPKVLECIDLERGLHTQNKSVPPATLKQEEEEE
jgi:hypothetical protein